MPIVCTLQGEDLFLDNLQEPWKSESLALIRQSIGDVDVYIAVSDYYQDFMSTYLGIPRERIRVVPLGITIDGHRPKPVRLEPPYTIGYFARIAPEKGLHVLVEAYRRLRQRPGVPPTKLLVAGYMLDEHRGYLKEIETRIREWGLAGEYRYAGAPDRAGKLALLQEMDVFSVPAVYAEPKGLSLLEAMASGLPIVQPRPRCVHRDRRADRRRRAGRAGRSGCARRRAPRAPHRSRARRGPRHARRRGRPQLLHEGAYGGVGRAGLQRVSRGALRSAAQRPELTRAMLIAKGVSKSYATANGPLPILAKASIEVKRGESVAVMGPSGCGKSTLLYLLGALEPPTDGTITIDGTDPYTLDERAQATFRGKHIGFVFQDHLLLPQLSAIENVLVPTLVAPADAGMTARADRLLDAVGLTPRRRHRPGELSGGERQRVAIARALVRSPSVLLCDEPTGNLDRASADAVTDLLVALHREQQTVLVVVTHSATVASRFDRRYELRDARLHPIA